MSDHIGDATQMIDLDHAELLANLRKVESGQDDGFDPAAACTMWHRNPEGPAAADLIEALRAERDEAVKVVGKTEAKLLEVEWRNPASVIADALDILQSIARETGND